MLIKQIADQLNISPRTIRFYEEKGLISPDKVAHNQYRTFSEQEVWRLQTIISLREVGMSIHDIKMALEKVDKGDPDEVLYYLELQRSVIFSQWVELKQMIDITDKMIHSVRQKEILATDDIYRLAEGSKRLRQLRRKWRDRWNYDELALSHDQRVLTDHDLYEDYDQALDTIVGRVAPLRGEFGLDLGTGTGNLAGRFLEKGANMAGVDQSRQMLKECQLKFPLITAKLGNFLAIPFHDGTFDFVVTSFAFRHLSGGQKTLALEEMCRVLKPDGRICITDLMIEEEFQRLISWFEQHGFNTEGSRINKKLYTVYASR